MPYNILIVDDHPLVREGLALLVASLPGGATVHQAANAAQALEQAEFHTPLDAVLLDTGLPDADGGGLIRALSARGGGAPVVVVSGTETPDSIARLHQLGAAAFVSKSRSGAEVVSALKRVMALSGQGSQGTDPEAGPAPPVQEVPALAPPGITLAQAPLGAHLSLSARQLDVLLMLDQGLSNKAISLQLGLSEKTVKNHVTGLLNALGAANRLHALRRARDLGLVK